MFQPLERFGVPVTSDKQATGLNCKWEKVEVRGRAPTGLLSADLQTAVLQVLLVLIAAEGFSEVRTDGFISGKKGNLQRKQGK